MGDDELAELRARRMAEMQAQQSDSGEQRKRQEDAKNAMLGQILDQAARARLSSIAVVKPEKAQMIEAMLLKMAQTGQIQGKVNESQLKQLLEQVSDQVTKKTTVKFSRRGGDSDDD